MKYIVDSFEKFDIDAKISYSYYNRCINYGLLYNSDRKTVNYNEIVDVFINTVKEIRKIDNVLLPCSKIGDDYISIKVYLED